MTVATLPPTIVITGASAGIGEETAILFAEKGWKVIIAARRVDRLEALSKRLAKKNHDNAVALELDVTDDQSVKNFAANALKACDGQIDVLFNNAGLALGVDHVATGNVADWDVMINTNITGLLRVTRELLPAMKMKNHGHIINMGSIASSVVYEGGSVYCATKHAVRAITKTLRLELNGTAIRVSLIDPGMVETDFSLVRFKDDQDRAKSVYKGLKPLTPKDIAECILFMADRPSHVNIDEIVLMPIAQAAPHKINRS